MTISKIFYIKNFFANKMKHTELTLLKHPKVRSIIDPKTVICVCGKRVRLDRNFDPDLLNRHVKNNVCKSDDGNSKITQFFSDQSSENLKKKKTLYWIKQ
jgi:hypothetical protein